MENEKRKYKRIALFPVVVKLTDGQSVYTGFIRDLNETGIQICMGGKVENMENLYINIEQPMNPEASSLMIDAEQLWITQISNIDYYEIGCQFKNITPNQKEQIAQLISVMEL